MNSLKGSYNLKNTSLKQYHSKVSHNSTDTLKKCIYKEVFLQEDR